MKELHRFTEEPILWCMIFHPIEIMEMEDIIFFHLWKEDDLLEVIEKLYWLNKISLN